MKSDQEIHATDVWSDAKERSLKDFILSHSEKQSPERKLRNELLAIRYKLEDYIESDKADQKLHALDFVKMYLKALNATQKSLAELFEMGEGNLHKYLTGERRLNKDIALKLGAFSHTDPVCWLRVEIKNDLMEIRQEKASVKEYEKKYDYRNLLAAAGR